MSKYTEAMSSIIYTMHYRVKPKYLGHVEDENMDLMYELAEKASPKKPIEAPERWNKYYWVCPTCEKLNPRVFNLNYCGYCGQKIDWSEDENHLIEGDKNE